MKVRGVSSKDNGIGLKCSGSSVKDNYKEAEGAAEEGTAAEDVSVGGVWGNWCRKEEDEECGDMLECSGCREWYKFPCIEEKGGKGALAMVQHAVKRAAKPIFFPFTSAIFPSPNSYLIQTQSSFLPPGQGHLICASNRPTQLHAHASSHVLAIIL